MLCRFALLCCILVVDFAQASTCYFQEETCWGKTVTCCRSVANLGREKVGKIIPQRLNSRKVIYGAVIGTLAINTLIINGLLYPSMGDEPTTCPALTPSPNSIAPAATNATLSFVSTLAPAVAGECEKLVAAHAWTIGGLLLRFATFGLMGNLDSLCSIPEGSSFEKSCFHTVLEPRCENGQVICTLKARCSGGYWNPSTFLWNQKDAERFIIENRNGHLVRIDYKCSPWLRIPLLQHGCRLKVLRREGDDCSHEFQCGERRSTYEFKINLPISTNNVSGRIVEVSKCDSRHKLRVLSLNPLSLDFKVGGTCIVKLSSKHCNADVSGKFFKDAHQVTIWQDGNMCHVSALTNHGSQEASWGVQAAVQKSALYLNHADKLDVLWKNQTSMCYVAANHIMLGHVLSPFGSLPWKDGNHYVRVVELEKSFNPFTDMCSMTVRVQARGQRIESDKVYVEWSPFEVLQNLTAVLEGFIHEKEVWEKGRKAKTLESWAKIVLLYNLLSHQCDQGNVTLRDYQLGCSSGDRWLPLPDKGLIVHP